MDPVWEAVRMKSCRMCVEGDGAGHCCLPRSEVCVLTEMYREVWNMLNGDPLKWRKSSVEEIGRSICVRCRHGQSDGHCDERRREECTLIRFLPDLVEMRRSSGIFRAAQLEAGLT